MTSRKDVSTTTISAHVLNPGRQPSAAWQMDRSVRLPMRKGARIDWKALWLIGRLVGRRVAQGHERNEQDGPERA